MKPKIIVLFALVFLCCHIIPVAAEVNTDINELLPNEYKKNKFKKNTDLIHDSSNMKEMEEISKEQQAISFTGEKVFNPDDTRNELFLSMSNENSTIKDKAENLNLFSKSETSAFASNSSIETTSSSFQLLIGILIGVCIVVLIIVLTIYHRLSSSKN